MQQAFFITKFKKGESLNFCCENWKIDLFPFPNLQNLSVLQHWTQCGNECLRNSSLFFYFVFISARSLGSVSLRRAMDKRTHFFFNYFTVDFNEVKYMKKRCKFVSKTRINFEAFISIYCLLTLLHWMCLCR